MTLNAVRYCAIQIFATLIAALIPATFVGGMRFIGALEIGQRLSVATGFGIAFFLFTYAAVVVIASVWGLKLTARRVREVGTTFDFLGSLSPQDRRKFEKEHGI
jgi:hypothetical protein